MEKLNAIKISPPPSPNRDEFPFVGATNVQGLMIDLENLAGSVREGKGPNGSTWKTKMRYHYGEIRKTKGTDRDKLDVYIGPNPQSKRVFIVHQNFPSNHPSRAGKYDEDKVMLGFNSPEEAKRAYIKQYSRKDFFRSLTEMPMAQFKKSVFKENKGEKIAALLGLNKLSEDYKTKTVYRPFKREVFADAYNPWEQIDLSQASPEERGKSFFVRGGSFSATPDPKEFTRLLKEREFLWDAEPRLRAKWTEFMGQYPNWYPHHEQPPQEEDATMYGDQEKGAACKTPGEKIKSKGKGRGLARGKSKGPVGVPIAHKLREFSKTRKKDKRPDNFIRERMKTGSLHDAYILGVKTAVLAAGTPMGALAKSKPMQQYGVITAPTMASGAPPASSVGAAETK